MTSPASAAVPGRGFFAFQRLLSNRPRVLYPFSMPRRGNLGLFLSAATRNRLVIQVTCNWCRQVRYYDPDDMRQLLGDVEIDSLRMRLKCEDCGKRDYVEVEGVTIHAADRDGKVMRRLSSIRIIRRPVWRDQPM